MEDKFLPRDVKERGEDLKKVRVNLAKRKCDTPNSIRNELSNCESLEQFNEIMGKRLSDQIFGEIFDDIEKSSNIFNLIDIFKKYIDFFYILSGETVENKDYTEDENFNTLKKNVKKKLLKQFDDPQNKFNEEKRLEIFGKSTLYIILNTRYYVQDDFESSVSFGEIENDEPDVYDGFDSKKYKYDSTFDGDEMNTIMDHYVDDEDDI